MEKYVVFDLDATLCNDEHRRHLVERPPKDIIKYNELAKYDTVYENILSQLIIHYNQNYKIIFCTGREETFKKDTIIWLEKHIQFLKDYILLMRPEKNYIKAPLIKEQLLEPYFNQIEIAYDDFDQILDLYRSRNIPKLYLCKLGIFYNYDEICNTTISIA